MTPEEKAAQIANRILSGFSWTARHEGDPLQFIAGELATALKAERDAGRREGLLEGDERYLSLCYSAGRVIECAANANLPEQKIVSLSLRDFRALRALGERIKELHEKLGALADAGKRGD